MVLYLGGVVEDVVGGVFDDFFEVFVFEFGIWD